MKAWAIGLLLLGFGCSKTDNDEAARIWAKLHEFRRLTTAEKMAGTEVLSRMPCSTPLVCATRDGCASAYRRMTSAGLVMERLEAEVDHLQGEPSLAKRDELEVKLTDLYRAMNEVDDSRPALRECERLNSTMREFYRIY